MTRAFFALLHSAARVLFGAYIYIYTVVERRALMKMFFERMLYVSTGMITLKPRILRSYYCVYLVSELKVNLNICLYIFISIII